MATAYPKDSWACQGVTKDCRDQAHNERLQEEDWRRAANPEERRDAEDNGEKENKNNSKQKTKNKEDASNLKPAWEMLALVKVEKQIELFEGAPLHLTMTPQPRCTYDQVHRFLGAQH